MVQRRAIDRADAALQPDRLPTLYKALIPLTAERHGQYYLSDSRSFSFAGMVNALPLTGDEFPSALRSYPIVFTQGTAPQPMALLGATSGQNDFVDADGAWSDGAYIPAYVRRYPFAYVRESQSSDRNILCADLSSIQFETQGAPDRALFHDGKPGPVIDRVMDYCNRYEQSVQRTKALVDEALSLDLIEPSTVTISRNGKSIKVEGFQMISEEKLRKLPDDTLAGLARRGVLALYTAHHLSLSNFSSLGGTS